MLADKWNGYNGLTPTGGFIIPLHQSIPAENDTLHSLGIYPPASAEETWVFHIREDVPWQNPAYGTVKPSDLVYSIQRGLLQDAPTGVQWLMYVPLLGVGGSSNWYNASKVIPPSKYNGPSGLGAAVKGAVQCNDTTGYVAFNLVAPYVPFMQILTQSWAFVTNEEWCVERGCIDTTIALSDNPNNYTEFIDHYVPTLSPLMESSVITDPNFPLMGTGPYVLKVFNADPHTGFQRFQRFVNYWQGWGANYAEYTVIKIVEEWANRKFQFLSTTSTQVDLTDVPRSNCAELHVSDKNSATLPGLSLTKYSQQAADYYFFNYKVLNVSAGFTPQLGGVDNATLFSDRDLREAFMYCFNASQFLIQYFLGEATQPTSYMCAGTAYYNDTVAVRQYDIDKAVEHFKKAWGGKVWSQGITVKLVYNTGNIARQTIATMISDVIARINHDYSKSLIVTPDGEPWGIYLGAMHSHALSCFTVGWIADYPDPDDWASPFMASYGAFSGIAQQIQYGLNTTSLNDAWSSMRPYPSYGPIPFTDPLGNYVTGLNNTYVDYLIGKAPAQSPAVREQIYNELMDIYYAEAASIPTDQGIARHYERDWIHGWIGGYSNNPVAFGPYFYQMWKAVPSGYTLTSINLNALTSITPATTVYRVEHQDAGIIMWNGTYVTIDYTVHVTYVNATGPTIWLTLGLEGIDIYTGLGTFVDVQTKTLNPGGSLTWTLTWNALNLTLTNTTYAITFATNPIGAAGGYTLYPTNSATLAINSTAWVKVGPRILGDLGSPSSSAPFWTFGEFDGKVTSADTTMYIQCLRGIAPTEFMYLGDLGSPKSTAPFWQMYVYDKAVQSADTTIYIKCKNDYLSSGIIYIGP
jgi:peptide/nickel transport system substrate-binding protein